LDTPAPPMIFIGRIETSAAEMNELEKASVSCYLHLTTEHVGVE